MTENFEIKVWAQMFFDDGSVSQGKRVPASILDDDMGALKQIAHKFLEETHRTEGLLLVWGAGNIFFRHYALETAISSS